MDCIYASRYTTSVHVVFFLVDVHMCSDVASDTGQTNEKFIIFYYYKRVKYAIKQTPTSYPHMISLASNQSFFCHFRKYRIKYDANYILTVSKYMMEPFLVLLAPIDGHFKMFTQNKSLVRIISCCVSPPPHKRLILPNQPTVLLSQHKVLDINQTKMYARTKVSDGYGLGNKSSRNRMNFQHNFFELEAVFRYFGLQTSARLWKKVATFYKITIRTVENAERMVA